jgi:WD40 repeat protein
MNPNGDTFISVSTDGTVCVRHVSDGKEIFCRTYPSEINDAIFVRDGASIAIAEQAGVVHILNAESGELERDIEGDAAPRDLDSARKGQVLAIGKQDGNITILDINEPDNQADNFFLSGGNLALIDLSPNGQWLAAGSQRGNTAIWNLNSKQSPFNVGHKAAVLALQFSPSNRFLLSGGADNSAIGFDIPLKDEVFRLPHLDWVTDIEFPSGESSWFATASDDTRVRVWDLATAQERLTMFQDGPVKDAAISADKKWIAATGDDRTARVWSAYNGVEMYQIPLKAPGSTVAFSNDDHYLITGDAEGHLDLWDISGLTSPLGYTEMSKLALISKFTPTGNQLIVSDSNQVWALNQPNITQLAGSLPASPVFNPPKGNIRDIVISPDSKSIAVSTDGGEYYIQNLQTRSFERVIPSEGSDASVLAFSSDGSLLITGSNDGALETWDVKTGEGTANQTNVGTAIYSLAAGPANVAVGLADKIVLYDSSAAQKTGELESPGENRFLAFNADGSVLTAVNSAGKVQTWKVENGEFKALPPVMKEPAYSIALNPAGDLLALAAANKVYLIDTIEGREVSRIPHKGIVYNVSFSPDGKILATASQKIVQFWDTSNFPTLTLEDPIQAASSRLIENFSQTQWTALFGDVKYEKLCENLPEPQ